MKQEKSFVHRPLQYNRKSYCSRFFANGVFFSLSPGSCLLQLNPPIRNGHIIISGISTICSIMYQFMGLRQKFRLWLVRMVPDDPGNTEADPIKKKRRMLQCMKWFKRYIVRTRTHEVCNIKIFVGEHHSDFNNLIFCVQFFPVSLLF